MKQDQIKLVFIGDIKTGKTTFSKYLIDGYKSINFGEYFESNGIIKITCLIYGILQV